MFGPWGRRPTRLGMALGQAQPAYYQQQSYQQPPPYGMQQAQGQAFVQNGQTYTQQQGGQQGGYHPDQLGYPPGPSQNPPQQTYSGGGGGGLQQAQGQAFVQNGQQYQAPASGGPQGGSHPNQLGQNPQAYGGGSALAGTQTGTAGTQSGGGLQGSQLQNFAVSDERQKVMKRLEAIELRLGIGR